MMACVKVIEHDGSVERDFCPHQAPKMCLQVIVSFGRLALEPPGELNNHRDSWFCRCRRRQPSVGLGVIGCEYMFKRLGR